jgi:RNA polymerase sigma-70 factor (ECF subfamily)
MKASKGKVVGAHSIMVDSLKREEFFKQILDYWQPSLKRLCIGCEYNTDRQRELLQEIYLNLWKALPSFSEKSSLRTWTFRVAHNVAAGHAFRSSREPVFKASGQTEGLKAQGQNPEVTLDKKRSLHKLQEEIQQLPPLDREIILLCLEEIPHQEIADITGLSEGNISTRLHRIKLRLKQRFNGE